MSVTFYAIDKNNTKTVTLSDGRTQEVASRIDLGDEHDLNMANGNAFRFLGWLDMLRYCQDLMGQCSVAEARRAIMLAKATDRAGMFARPEEIVHGDPRTNGDGTIELRPLRLVNCGLSEDDLQMRLERFEAFVEAAAAKNATDITWA